MFISKKIALKLPTPLLASLIVHETVHSHQNYMFFVKHLYGETEAYQAQSDFLNKISFTVSLSSPTLNSDFPNQNTRDFLKD
ncbi:MAG: hypothetical protein LBE12_18320 [Planctomycetaceae bacterium]|jgi:hypothetical protein|nr:hypothetical protein [Planctomycetaceae bacterium]